MIRLQEIEFAINLSRSETTGYAPFFLNSGRLPRSFVWNDATSDGYPSVGVFAQSMEMAVMSAHDAILEVRTKQTRTANRKRRITPFENGDITYVSAKNMSLPKVHAGKLIPKYIAPYRIVRDFGNNSFELN